MARSGIGQLLGEVDRALDGQPAVLEAVSCLGLAHVRADDTERHGGIAVETHVGQALCGGVGDDLVVTGVAGDDRADHGDSIDVLAAGQPVGSQRRVVGAGHLDGRDDVGVPRSCGLASRLRHPVDDRPFLVELRDHQTEPYHTSSVATAIHRTTEGICSRQPSTVAAHGGPAGPERVPVGPEEFYAPRHSPPAMATVDAASLRSRATSALDRVGLDPVHVVVLDVALLGLVARLYDLGGRVAHWDEARVVYWTLRYIETGNVEYRPIIHGPFYHHVNRVVFDVFGTTDFSMRLAVAVLSAGLPLTALLLRDRLSDLEVAALAGFLAFNPALVYYSRFMRGDPLVAAFAFAAFAFGVAVIDTGRRRYFLAAVAAFALALTVKENAILYPVCWLGATVLAVDHGLLWDREYDGEWLFLARDYVRRALGLLRRHVLVVVVGAVEFLAILVFFYAPRTRTESGPGLGKVLENPGMAPEVLWLSTGGAWAELWSGWIQGSHQDHSYIPYLGDFLQSMGYGALALSMLAVLGFVVDRYSEEGPTTVVQFGFYWGFASVLGYPLVTDIMAPWATVNAIVALAIPAAAGFAVLVRWGSTAVDAADHVTLGLAVFAVVLVVGQVGATTAGAVYANPQAESNHLVQYAQPAGDIGPVTDVFHEAGATPGGPDVVFYGEFFVDGGAPTVPRKPGCIKWFNALPLPWYVGASDAEVACAGNETALDSTLAGAETGPAVVVVHEDDAATVAGSLPDYEPHTYLLRLSDTPTTFFVHEDYADSLSAPPDELPTGPPPQSSRVTADGHLDRMPAEGHAYSGAWATPGR